MRVTATLHRASSPLSIFRNRDFAFVWGSTALVGVGTQMESAVLGWFVLTLTDSPFLVGAIAAARMALNFLALFTGAIADRLPRNRLLASVEFIMGAMGALMLALILTGTLEVWHIFAITLVMGVVRLCQMPVAQSPGGRYPAHGSTESRRRVQHRSHEHCDALRPGDWWLSI